MPEKHINFALNNLTITIVKKCQGEVVSIKNLPPRGTYRKMTCRNSLDRLPRQIRIKETSPSPFGSTYTPKA